MTRTAVLTPDIGLTVARVLGTTVVALSLMLGALGAVRPAAARVLPAPLVVADLPTPAAAQAVDVNFKGHGFKKFGHGHGFKKFGHGHGFKKFGHGHGFKKFGFKRGHGFKKFGFGHRRGFKKFGFRGRGFRRH